MQKNIVDDKMGKIDSLRPIAKSLDCTLAQLSIAWCAKNEDVSTVILGGTKAEQVGPACPLLFLRSWDQSAAVGARRRMTHLALHMSLSLVTRGSVNRELCM